MLKKMDDDFDIGKKLIVNAINLDEALVEILKLEIKKTKKLIELNSNMDGVSELSRTLKHVIIALTLTEEKIKTGMSFCRADN